MTVEVQKIRLGTKEDGSPSYHYHAPEGHAVFTGPITGTVDTSKGTVDVSADPIFLDTEEHAAEVADAIGRRYEAEGHPQHDDDNPFVYTAPTTKKAAK